MKVFFKNQLIDEDLAKVSISDRSFRFGDGVFETLFVYQTKIWDFKTHYNRLKAGLEAFFIDIDLSDLENKCKELININKIQTGYLRIIVSRGENQAGAIGYLPKDTNPYMIIQGFEKPLPEFSVLDLYVSSYTAHQKLVSKVNSSTLYVLSMIEAQKNSCDNALILDTNTSICETASGNIFWFVGDEIFTPSLDLPFVPGTVRKKILECAQVHEGKFSLEDIKSADEIFMSNIGYMIAGIKSIKAFDGLIVKSKSFDKTLKLRSLLLKSISSEA